MDSLPRKWNCSHCGRLNRSLIGGESVCPYCRRVTVVAAALVPKSGPPEEAAEVLAVPRRESGVKS